MIAKTHLQSVSDTNEHPQQSPVFPHHAVILTNYNLMIRSFCTFLSHYFTTFPPALVQVKTVMLIFKSELHS